MGEKEEAKLKSRQSIKTGGENARVYVCVCACSCLYTAGTLHLMGRGHISLHWLLMHFPSMQLSDCQAWFTMNQHQLELFMFACLSHPSKWRWPARRCRTRRIYPWRCRWRDSQHPGQHGKQKKTDYNVFIAAERRGSGSWVGCWLKIQALSSSLLVSCRLLPRRGTHTSTPTHTHQSAFCEQPLLELCCLWWVSPRIAPFSSPFIYRDGEKSCRPCTQTEIQCCWSIGPFEVALHNVNTH